MDLRRRPSGAATGATAIQAGRSLQATRRWTAELHGYTAHFGSIHAPSNSLLVADGWGVAVAGLRFRRFDLGSGAERASIRTGTAVRCRAVVPGDEELIVATDTKLFRLGLDGLDERQRWDRRIPRYANTIVLRGSFVVMADWMNPRVSIVDLAGGGIRRRSSQPIVAVIDGPGDPLLVGGAAAGGGIASIDPRSGTIGPTLEAPPAIDVAVDHDDASVWMTTGVRGTWTLTRVTPASPTRRLRRQWLDGSRPAEEFELPAGALQIAIGSRELWLASDEALIAVPLPVGSEAGRIWPGPSGQAIRWFHPDLRVAVTVGRRFDATTDNATMTAFDLA